MGCKLVPMAYNSTMEVVNLYQVVILIGIALIILELILGAASGFDLFLLGVILIISGSIGLMAGSIPLMLVLVMTLSLAYIFLGRRFIRSRLSITTTQTNVEALIGKEAVVFKAIPQHGAGQIKVNGEIWRAEAVDAIETGEKVIIRSVSGVTFHVERA